MKHDAFSEGWFGLTVPDAQTGAEPHPDEKELPRPSLGALRNARRLHAALPPRRLRGAGASAAPLRCLCGAVPQRCLSVPLRVESERP